MRIAVMSVTGLATVVLVAGCLDSTSRRVPPDAAKRSAIADAPVETLGPKSPAQQRAELRREAADLDQRLAAGTATASDCARLAILRHELGDQVASINAWRTAVRLAPGDDRMRVGLAGALLLAGDCEAAKIEAEAARGAVLPGPLARLLNSEPNLPRTRLTRRTPPVIVQVLPPVRVDNAPASYLVAETSITASAQNPMEVLTAWIDYRGGDWRLRYGISVDGGQTWNDKRLTPPAIPGLEPDPMTAYDPTTDLMWAGGLCEATYPGMYVSRRNPGALSVLPAVWAYQAGADKGWMAAGPVPGAPDQTRLYLGFTSGVLASSDLGAHWVSIQGPVSYKHALMPRVASDGTLYILSWNTSNTYHIEKSTDGGATFSPMTVVAVRMDSWIFGYDHFPGEYKVRAFGYLAVDPVDGTLYVIYMDTTNTLPGGSYNVDIYFTRSTDGGATWTTPHVLNGDGSPPGDQFFPWIEADAQGRLHVLYYDTRRNPLPDSAPTAHIDAYYATSADQGDTWQEYRLTDQPFTFGTGFLGDYNGLAVAGNRVYAAYPYAFTGTDLDMVVSTVVLTEPAPGDLDADGDVDAADISVFVAVLLGLDTDPQHMTGADLDLSGVADGQDVEPFVNALLGR
jgi:hypothetical protein